MGYKVLTLADLDLWQSYMERLPPRLRHVFFTPSYYALYARKDRVPRCFIFTDADKLAVYPFLQSVLTSDGRRYTDMEGAYGYNGAVANAHDEGFATAFADALGAFCREERVVAEFVRVDPVVQKDLLCGHLQLTAVNRNVIVDLRLSEEELWMSSYEHCVRKNVNKAKTMGVSVRVLGGEEMSDADLRSFAGIYRHTMERNGSAGEYYYEEGYFKDVCGKLGRNSSFYFASLDGRDISCELVLTGGDTGYSFLGGTLAEAQEARPNSILKDHLIRDLKRKGFTYYCIGGGKALDDGIFKYKKTFARNGTVDFYIGTRVHDRQAYDALCRDWEQRFPEKKVACGRMFLRYKC